MFRGVRRGLHVLEICDLPGRCDHTDHRCRCRAADAGWAGDLRPRLRLLIPGVLFYGSNDGALRAHSTSDGSILWEFDTNREFETLNRVRAGGGAIQGPGPTIAGGMLYLNSGYGDHLGRPGNVLLAFGVD